MYKRQVVDGTSYQTEKTVQVLQKNRLTIYNELTGSGKELYENEESVFLVRLWDERGNELAGTYSYSGSREGTMRSGDRLSLAGNEFITIDPADFKNCAYEVTRIEAVSYTHLDVYERQDFRCPADG